MSCPACGARVVQDGPWRRFYCSAQCRRTAERARRLTRGAITDVDRFVADLEAAAANGRRVARQARLAP